MGEHVTVPELYSENEQLEHDNDSKDILWKELLEFNVRIACEWYIQNKSASTIELKQYKTNIMQLNNIMQQLTNDNNAKDKLIQELNDNINSYEKKLIELNSVIEGSNSEGNSNNNTSIQEDEKKDDEEEEAQHCVVLERNSNINSNNNTSIQEDEKKDDKEEEAQHCVVLERLLLNYFNDIDTCEKKIIELNSIIQESNSNSNNNTSIQEDEKKDDEEEEAQHCVVLERLLLNYVNDIDKYEKKII